MRYFTPMLPQGSLNDVVLNLDPNDNNLLSVSTLYLFHRQILVLTLINQLKLVFIQLTFVFRLSVGELFNILGSIISFLIFELRQVLLTLTAGQDAGTTGLPLGRRGLAFGC